MKHKNLLAISALALTATMLFACGKNGGKSNPPRPTMYTVTFYNGEQVFETTQVEEGELVSKPTTDPQRAGFDFTGWFTQATGGEEWLFNVNPVIEDLNLYAQFQESQVNYTVNFLVNGEVAATGTTNSRDQNNVVAPQVNVGVGNSLLGYGDVVGTNVSFVDYRVGAEIPYNEIYRLADDQHVLNLHAIIKAGEIIRLNVGVWGRYVDEAGFNRIYNAFKAHANNQGLTFDFLDYTYLNINRVADFAAAILEDGTINVAFPSGSNFIDQTDIDTVYTKHALVGTVESSDGTKATGRYVTALSSLDIVDDFYDWVLSDEGKLACDSDYEPPKPYPVEEADANKLVIGVWGRWLPTEHATSVLNAWKTYATAQSITYTEAKIEYYTGTTNADPYFNKANYLEAVGDNPAIDVILPVTLSIAKGEDSDGATYGVNSKIVTTVNLGTGDDGLGLTIEGKTDRAMATLNSDALTASFVTFVNTDEGKKALDPTYGEQTQIQTTLKISYYGRYITEANANAITAKIQEYITGKGISFTSITTDYVDAATGNNNANYVAAIADDADLVLCGASALTSVLNGDERFTVVSSETIGTIQGQSSRLVHVLVDGNLSQAAVEYLISDAGKTYLAGLTA